MDSAEGLYVTRKIMDHALELQETVSMPLSSPHATPTPSHYLSLDMPKNIIEQLEMGKSSMTVTEKEIIMQ